MVKIKAFLVAVLLVAVTMVGLQGWYGLKVEDYYHVDDNSLRYDIHEAKFKSHDMLRSGLTSNSLLVMGSSELSTTIKEGFHPRQVFNHEDFSMMLVGSGTYQNIILATILGSIGEHIPNNKVAMIQSMQWFHPKGISKEAFLARLSLDHVQHLLANPKIQLETKKRLMQRLLELAEGNQIRYKLQTMQRIYIDQIAADWEKEWFEWKLSLDVFKNKLDFYRGNYLKPLPLAEGKTPDYDWAKQLAEQNALAVDRTTNNDFQIDNKTYTEKYDGKIAKYKGKMTKDDYTQSPEYRDLELFIDIAKDLGVQLKMVIQPVMGKWYDYTGFSVEQRQAYYTKLKQILDERQVPYLDYSAHEYDDYYFYDAYHIGWGGWTELEKDLYEFYQAP